MAKRRQSPPNTAIIIQMIASVPPPSSLSIGAAVLAVGAEDDGSFVGLEGTEIGKAVGAALEGS